MYLATLMSRESAQRVLGGSRSRGRGWGGLGTIGEDEEVNEMPLCRDGRRSARARSKDGVGSGGQGRLIWAVPCCDAPKAVYACLQQRD